MKTADQVSSFFFLILSIFVCLEASQQHLGSFGKPGSGFFPFLLGIAIGILSLLFLIKTKFEKRVASEERTLWSGARKPGKVLYLFLALASYSFFLEKLGYTLTTFLLFVLILRGINPQKWYVVVGGALIASVGSYVIFQLGLLVQLPRGFLGF